MKRELLLSAVLSAVLSAAIATLGCVGTSDGTGDGTAYGARSGDANAPAATGGGKRYGLGSSARPADIAKMDTDISSDGAELPAGKGTVAEGAALYTAQCAMCHGVNGEGMAPAFPQLSGRDPKAEGFNFSSDPRLPRTIGNYWSHATTLFDYIKRAMPHVAPGSLTDDQVYALSAYLLAKDSIIADDATLDAASLRAVKMPYADRFVPDDRRPGPAK